jgi:phage shock protein PspC (stress-responsive transcriptional regulator)
MNKTIIINIGNTIIHIEEDAYEVLMNYLNEIKQHFARSADEFEIVKDIENRIAEMIAEILHKNQKSAIDSDDISQIISQMGSVQEFGDEEAQPPSNPQNYITAKKLYRDTDRKIIAGVCSGLSHYLNVKMIWIRLFFFLLVWLFGTGVLVYLIAWILVPKANSRADKMMMKGETTNLQGYKNSLSEDLTRLNEQSNTNYRQRKSVFHWVGQFIEAIFTGIARLISAIVRLFAKVFAWFVILFGFGAMIMLIIVLGVFLGLWDDSVYHTFPFSILNVSYKTELVFSAFFTLFIPVLALVLFALKLVQSHIQISRYFSFTLLGVWIVATIITSFNVARIVSGFNEEAKIAQTLELKPYKNLIFKVDATIPFTASDSINYQLDKNGSNFKVVIDKNSSGIFVEPKNVRLVFEPALDQKISATQTFQSNGKTFQEALGNAQNISYKYQTSDSIFTLTPRAKLLKKAAWREQGVVFTFKIPIGTQITIQKDLYDYIKFYYLCNHDLDETNTDSEVWVMTENGLRCKLELEQEKNKTKQQADENE